MLVGSLALGLLAAATAWLLQVRGRGQDDRFALLIVVAPVYFLQVRNLGVEALALALALAGLVLWTRADPRRGLAAGLFVLATLARETMILFPVVIGLESLVRRRLRGRDLALLLLSPLVYAGWAGVVRARYGGFGGGSNLGPPLVGLLDAIQGWASTDWIVVGLTLGVSAVALFKDHKSILAWLIAAYWVFALFLGAPVWFNWEQFSRILFPVVVCSLVVLIPEHRDDPASVATGPGAAPAPSPG